ncbi:MAG: 16S rRNA (cytidine(1402)-2'-O)-methyltransferase [Alphaproteobacteria bacterium]|nr:16S rRNA (cytidine(1402)-2'-O)-methyltransferase [Alphaproteobacteria bacterium]
MASNNPISREEEPEESRETIGGPGPSKLPAGLYLVATPIGNLGDISRRAVATLERADRIAAEDTRTTRKLLAALGVPARRLERYDDHADDAARARLVAAIAAGEAVALVSDAGMPLIADPGYKLVRAARAAGLRVTAVPGASAPLMALALSGLPTDRFFFGGFLPAKAGARRTAIAALAAIDATLVLFEAPQRLAESLADLAAGLGARRPAAIARELTKLFEELRTGSLADLAAHYAAVPQPKGEIVVVIGGPVEADAVATDDAAIDRQLRAAMATMSLRDAVAAVAGATGQPKRAIYARALALGTSSRP